MSYLKSFLVVCERQEMDTSSETSSLGKEYDDGVYDKVEAQTQYEYTPRSQSPIREQTAPKLPVVILTCLVFLFIFCFIGILVSGLHFGHRINDPGNCLGQSWVMFSVRKQQQEQEKTPPFPSHTVYVYVYVAAGYVGVSTPLSFKVSQRASLTPIVC